MSSTNHQERLLDTSFEDFATFLLPLYSGPQVAIRIGSASCEYVLPKALLCKLSPYFVSMFDGGFEESERQSTILKEMDGIVSTRRFQMLMQWLWIGRVVFGESTPKEAIATTVEFVKFAEMCGVIGMETLKAEHIREDPRTNTYYLDFQYIVSAASLPMGHPVRNVIAMAAIEGYLRHDEFKFLTENKELQNFLINLLQEVKATLRTSTQGKHYMTFKDPFSGETLRFEQVSGL